MGSIHERNTSARQTESRGERSLRGMIPAFLALLLCLALLGQGLGRLSAPAPENRESAPARVQAAEARGLSSRQEQDHARPAARNPAAKSAPEVPQLNRLHAVREYALEDDEEKLLGVTWYLYDDEDGIGWAEDENGRVLKTLTLNELGQISSAVFLDEDEEGELYREDYEYDEKGDYTRVRRYVDGELSLDYAYTYDRTHLLQAMVLTQYEKGREVKRTELEPLDDENLEMRCFVDGKSAGTGRIERDFEDGRPVAQRNYNPDGSLAYSLHWLRDPESLIQRTETRYPDGSVKIVENEYEPLGEISLFRYSYRASGSVETPDGEPELRVEEFYFYNDAEGTGRVEDGSGRLLQSLTLNEKGQVVGSIVYDENGAFAKRVEYEYDRFGNQSRVRYYDAEDTLLSEWEYRCNAFRVQEYRVNRQYKDGEEIQRLELVCLDRFHADFSIYYDGELSASQHFLYVYDGADLVEQRRINDDGSPGTSAYWTRDDDHNAIRYLTPAGPDSSSIEISAYERIG